MSKLNGMLRYIRVPQVARVRQRFDTTRLANPPRALVERLAAANPEIKPGARIAITAGSRGIAGYRLLLETIVSYVRGRGGEPFIVPAMGSHGGGTAEGQVDMLAHLGITQESVGAPILSSMEVVEIGRTELGLPALIDRNAYEADGIILFNRVKSHTSIRGEFESGLLKMLAIGLAKHKGAAMTHKLGVESLGANVVRVGKISLGKLNILCGVATIENGYSELADVYVLKSGEILEREPGILARAKRMIPGYCLKNIDALILAEQGKDISGTGMDPAVVGRPINKLPNDGPEVRALGVLRLTETSNGNCTGVGIADFCTKAIRDSMDREAVYVNTLTGMIPLLAKIPLTLDTEELVVKACIKASGVMHDEEAKLILSRSTKYLDEVYMSRPALAAVQDANAERLSAYEDVPFDGNGNLLYWL